MSALAPTATSPTGNAGGGESRRHLGGGSRFRPVAHFRKRLGETPVAPEPRESSLDHSAARQDDEALHVVAPIDDLHAQQRNVCHPSVNLPCFPQPRCSSKPARVGRGYTDMIQHFPEDRFTWLNLVGNTMPPRHPNNNNGDDDDEEEDDDEEDEDREPAVIREPDEDE
jgi:hypothetical protein